MPISEQDFKDYYIKAAKRLSCQEDWEPHTIFPREASTTEEGKRKALNALYRFLISGLAKFAFSSTMEGLKILEEAPLEPLPTITAEDWEQNRKYTDAWMVELLNGTDLFCHIIAPKLGLREPEGVRLSPHFRESLDAIFKQNNVGLEKEDVYPPYLKHR